MRGAAKRVLLLPAIAILLAAASEPPLPLDRQTEYIVQPGDTLNGIANRTKVPRVLIAEANGLEPPYPVHAGQTLVLPRTQHHTVKAGETGFAISFVYSVPWKDIAVANGIAPDAPLQAGQKLLIPTMLRKPEAASAPLAPVSSKPPRASVSPVASPAFAWPVRGDVRRGFVKRTNRNHHDGLDIVAARDTAVKAAADGRVIFAGTMGNYGRFVVIRHADGTWHSCYGFLNRITVKQGEDVTQGERIGLVGNGGLAKGYELHFEIRRNDKPVDPLPLLPRRP